MKCKVDDDEIIVEDTNLVGRYQKCTIYVTVMWEEETEDETETLLTQITPKLKTDHTTDAGVSE